MDDSPKDQIYRYIEHGDFAEALAELEPLVSSARTSDDLASLSELLEVRAECFLGLNQWDEALQDF